MHPETTVRFRTSVRPTPELKAAAQATATAIQNALPRPTPIHLTVQDNTRRMLGGRTVRGQLRLSVHWSLVTQTEDLVALLIHKDRTALGRLEARTPPSTPRRVRRRTAGRHHDLAELLHQVQEKDLSTPVPATITWGRRSRRPRRARCRSLLLGSRRPDGLIRIHPVLDDPFVPAWFVRYIIHHELLHGVFPPEKGPRGRRRIHPPAFRTAERAHPDHARATTWQRENLDRLIKASTGAKTLRP